MSYTTISGDTWDGIKRCTAQRYADYLMQQNSTKINVFRFDAGVVCHPCPAGRKRAAFAAVEIRGISYGNERKGKAHRDNLWYNSTPISEEGAGR